MTLVRDLREAVRRHESEAHMLRMAVQEIDASHKEICDLKARLRRFREEHIEMSKTLDAVIARPPGVSQ